MRKVVVLAVAVVAALGVTASSATSAASETGVTARTIVIGGTFPLTGPASLYAPIPASMKAYFSYINSRKGPDGRRGVYGRQIVFKHLRRRLQPGADRPADAEARRGGQGLRGGRLARHRAQRGDPPVPERPEDPADPQRDGCLGLVDGREAVPVDGRLAARVRLRGPHLRPGDRAQQPEREDRRPLPERQLRQGDPGRAQGGPRRQGVEHRGRGAVRGHRGGRSDPDREAPRVAAPRSS